MEIIQAFAEANNLPRFVVIIVIAALGHGTAILVSKLSLLLGGAVSHKSFSKVRTVITLASGSIVFVIYFLATGAILNEFGISLTAYLATASVIGLAVGFGSQSIVQDVVVGITVILSDLVDVNDMVEISGQTGIVQRIGMRFTVLKNAMGAEVYIPNRTLTNMINYPRGYVRCLVDITLPTDATLSEPILSVVADLVEGVDEQFPGILRAPIEIEPVRTTATGKSFVRIKFRIWPGRGGPLETSFRQDVVAALQGIDPEFRDSRITINYEVDQQPSPRVVL